MTTIYPVGVLSTVPESIEPLKALLVLDSYGLSAAYQAWATDPARTFAELVFINRATIWRRNDPVLLAGGAALNLTSNQIDELFVAASKLIA